MGWQLLCDPALDQMPCHSLGRNTFEQGSHCSLCNGPHTFGNVPGLNNRIPGRNSQDRWSQHPRGSVLKNCLGGQGGCCARGPCGGRCQTGFWLSLQELPGSGEACQGQELSGWNASQARGAEWRACGALARRVGQAQDDSGCNRLRLSHVLGCQAHVKWGKGSSVGIGPAPSLCPRSGLDMPSTTHRGRGEEPRPGRVESRPVTVTGERAAVEARAAPRQVGLGPPARAGRCRQAVGRRAAGRASG